MPGHIIAISVAPSKHAGQIAVSEAQLKTGKGIVGDRYYGFRKSQPGRNLTLIESEVIAEFNKFYQLRIPLNATRRNLITQGIRLDELLGQQFKVGDVLCEGIELCEPCKAMAKQFPAIPISQAAIIRAFTQKGGIRAKILTDGVVKLNDSIFLTERQN